MTTDDFTTAARAEAKDRWWNGAVPKDVNPPEAWILGFQEGAPWARDYLAAQEPTDTTPLQERIARAIYGSQEHTFFPADLDEAPRLLRESLLANAAAILPIIAAEVRHGKADAWDEACQAFAWCLDNGPIEDALPYVAEHNPYPEQEN